MIAALGARIPLEDVAVGARFLWSLPGFLRRPVTLDEARATLRRRLERREADFLGLARRAVYEHAASPYRALLRLAGCEYGDLERLVGREGVEGALRLLYRHGVYLTVDEFKGRRPTIRGNARIAVSPSRLRNPRLTVHVPARTSGSRGARTPVPIDLAFVRDRAVNTCLVLDARGGIGWAHAIWVVPGTAAIVPLLRLSAFGASPVRWFSQLGPAAPGLHPRYRWSARALRWASLLAGVPMPRPVHVSLEHPLPIARWMSEVLGTGRTPHLYTFVSPAVRLSQAALEAGVDLRGAQFTVTGEPLTAAAVAMVRRVGAEARPTYATSEIGAIGEGCLAPEAPDDVHLLHDRLALIRPESDARNSGLPARALLISSVRPTMPFILLNVSMGDQAEVGERACGCPLERLGWATHLHTIRSFEKLTAGGMTFFDSDVIRVLEEVLPARFGGGPTDYQLVEEEADDGRPHRRLLVHPAIGPLDEGAVSDTFLAAVGHGSGLERVMGQVWREGRLLHVERRAPRATATGKILHLHQHGRPADRPPA